jgi:hypothetical protein
VKLFILALVAGLCVAQPSAPLEMLLGRWAGRGPNGGLVEFHAGRENKEIIGRAKPRTPGAQWKRMMTIYPDGATVRADFFEGPGRTIHYKLESFDATTLRFVSGLHTLIYRRLGTALSYRFATDGKTTDSGILYFSVVLLP